MSRTALEEALEALTADALAEDEHPSPDEILAYHADELDDDARAHMQEHFAWCSECNRTVRDLASWPAVELRDPKLERTAEEEAADWQAIRQRLGKETPEAEDQAREPIPLVLPRPPPSPVPRPYLLLIAALLLAVLSLQIFRWSQEVGFPNPTANVFVVDLSPIGNAATRDESTRGPARTEVPAGMETVVFLLVQEDVRPFDGHAVELLDEDGHVFWQAGGLVSPPEGGFSVAVPFRTLPSNAIEIRLYGVDERERELLATYYTRIQPFAMD